MSRDVSWRFSIFLLLVFLQPMGYAISSQQPFVTSRMDYTYVGINQPTGIAVNPTGKSYLLDGVNRRVVVFSPDGDVILEFEEQGEAFSSRLHSMDVALTDTGQVIIADTARSQLSLYSEKGEFIRSISLVDKSYPEMTQPSSLIIQHDIVTWSDRKHHRLCQNRISTGKSLGCFGEQGNGEGEFQFPFMISSDRDGYLHVTDVLNGRVQVFNQQGQYFSDYGQFGTTPGTLYRPNGVAVDEHGFSYVSDSYMGLVSVFFRGRFVSYLGGQKGELIRFRSPVSLVYSNHHLFVVDTPLNLVSKLKIQFSIAEKLHGISDLQALSTSGKGCVSCHLTWSKNQRAVDLVNTKDGVPPVSSLRMCYSCHHGAVIDSRSALDNKHQHSTIYTATKKHGEKTERLKAIPAEFPLSPQDHLLCSSCHTPHGSEEDHQVLYSGHKNSWMRESNAESRTCENCHESKLVGAYNTDTKNKGQNHPLGIGLAPPPSEGHADFAKNDYLHQGLPKVLQESAGALGDSDQLICQTCHQIHGGSDADLLTLVNGEGALCIGCHNNLYTKNRKAARKQGIHPVNVSLEKVVTHNGKKIKRVTCSSCHSAHDNKSGSSLLTHAQNGNAKALCGSCHEKYFIEGEMQSVSAGKHQTIISLIEPIKIKGNEVQTVDCFTCHSVHGGLAGTASLVLDHSNGELCSTCHEKEQAVLKTDHDLRITNEQSINAHGELPSHAGLCGSCHSMHRASGKLPYLFNGGGQMTQPAWKKASDQPLFKRDQLCLQCHSEKGLAGKKVVEHFSHPSKDLILRSDQSVMPLVKSQNSPGELGIENVHEFGAIACITCHNPHQWEAIDASTVPFSATVPNNQEGTSQNSFLRNKGVSDTFCVDCHGQNALVKYKYYHHSKKARNIGADYLK